MHYNFVCYLILLVHEVQEKNLNKKVFFVVLLLLLNWQQTKVHLMVKII